MPLIKSKSDKAFKKNVATEVRSGKSVKQAAAIAYKTKGMAKKADGGSMDDAPPRTRYRPAPDARYYDSDIDYRDSLSGRGQEDEPEEQKPNRVVKAEKRRSESSSQKDKKLARMAAVAKGSGDDELAKQLKDRRWRMSYSDKLFKQAKDAPLGHRVRKDAQEKWSESIGKGKPAPFKTGGKAKSCW
jgi:hypothetical protein